MALIIGPGRVDSLATNAIVPRDSIGILPVLRERADQCPDGDPALIDLQARLGGVRATGIWFDKPVDQPVDLLLRCWFRSGRYGTHHAPLVTTPAHRER